MFIKNKIDMSIRRFFFLYVEWKILLIFCHNYTFAWRSLSGFIYSLSRIEKKKKKKGTFSHFILQILENNYFSFFSSLIIYYSFDWHLHLPCLQKEKKLKLSSYSVILVFFFKNTKNKQSNRITYQLQDLQTFLSFSFF